MKHINNKLKYIAFFAMLGLLFASCEDDEPVTAGLGDPSDKNVVNIEATISSDVTITGEGNRVNFTVTLPQSFSSDVTVTATARLDNGAATTGQAIIDAGATTGTGFVLIAPDDNVVSGATIDGVEDAINIKLTAILLDELVPDTTYTISSNELSLGIYPLTEPSGGGLGIALDADNSPSNDLALRVYDTTGSVRLENSDTSDRVETVQFTPANQPDGTYFVTTFARTETSVDYSFRLLFTLPNGELEVLTGTIPSDFDSFTLVDIATFDKVTDPETGVVSFINFTLVL